MKKLISGMTALTLAGLMAITASAQAADYTEIKPDPDNGFKPKPDKANTQVEFSIDPAYTVTIPALVTLEGEYGTTYTGKGTIETGKIFLKEDDKIVVTLKSASKFNMAHEGTGEYKLPYTASTAAFGNVDKENGGKVAEFPTSTEPASVDITFTTDETPQYAGKYADPVVFGISVEKEEA